MSQEEITSPDSASESDAPEVFAVSDEGGKLSFSRRNLIEAAGLIGTGIALVGSAGTTT